MAIFQFYKMAVAAILDFQNSNISTVGGCKRVEMCRQAKFGRNRQKQARTFVRISLIYFCK